MIFTWYHVNIIVNITATQVASSSSFQIPQPHKAYWERSYTRRIIFIKRLCACSLKNADQQWLINIESSLLTFIPKRIAEGEQTVFIICFKIRRFKEYGVQSRVALLFNVTVALFRYRPISIKRLWAQRVNLSLSSHHIWALVSWNIIEIFDSGQFYTCDWSTLTRLTISLAASGNRAVPTRHSHIFSVILLATE